MYRVELKVACIGAIQIPKANCGFLMYRVELKVVLVKDLFVWVFKQFLMYRVELKEWFFLLWF